MRKGRVAVFGATILALLLVGCGAGSGSGDSGGATRTVRVSLGQLRFAPDALTVKAGSTVTFVLVNEDAIDHEFVIGNEATQKEHEMAASSGDHGGHDPNRVPVPPNKTVRFEYTFDQPGTLLYGCHVAGHYGQGMKGTITVTA